MKKLFLSFICCFAVVFTAMAKPSFANESLTYKVLYKWGLIHKQAGTATLSIHENGDKYIARLTARSQPWADKYYKVRDTLNGTMYKEGLKPIFYEKIAHEGSEDKHDIVRFSYSGQIVTGLCSRVVKKKDKEPKTASMTLSASGTTVDMLSSFYLMRTLPFENWKDGHKYTCTIFSGKRKETLTITYHGTADVKVDNKSYHCFHITFTFTSNGGKKTSDDMDAWISTDARRIPVQLEGKLPVGKVRCQLT